MVIRTEDTFLRVRMVYSMFIRKETKKRVLKPWNWMSPFEMPTVDEDTIWHLEMSYLSEDEEKRFISWSGGKQPIETLRQDIISQIAAQDGSVMDEAFEKAIIRAGKK